LPRIGFFACGNLLRGSDRNHLAAPVSSLGAKIDDIIGRLDDIQIVFDHNDGIAGIRQTLQHVDQLVHIRNVQPGCRFIENIDRSARGAAGKLGGKLHALSLTAGKRRRRLTDLNITEPDLAECLQLALNLWHIGEEFKSLFHRHFQHIVNIFSLIFNFQCFAIVALAVADLARNVNIGKKMHFDLLDSVAFARFAAAALDVEGKAAGVVAAQLCVLRGCVQLADIVEHAGIGCRIGARGSADRRLRNIDDLVQLADSADFAVFSGAGFSSVELCGKSFVENFIDKRRFSRAGNAGHTDEHAERKINRDVLQVILLRSDDGQHLAVSRTANRGNPDFLFPAQILPRDGARALHDFACRAGTNNFAAVNSRSGANVDDRIGRKHGILVVFHHQYRVANIAQMLERCKQLVVIPLMQPDARFIQNIDHAHQRRTDLRRKADALTFAAGKRCRRTGKREIIQPDVLQEGKAAADFL